MVAAQRANRAIWLDRIRATVERTKPRRLFSVELVSRDDGRHVETLVGPGPIRHARAVMKSFYESSNPDFEFFRARVVAEPIA